MNSTKGMHLFMSMIFVSLRTIKCACTVMTSVWYCVLSTVTPVNYLAHLCIIQWLGGGGLYFV